jgi:hypothetical protein
MVQVGIRSAPSCARHPPWAGALHRSVALERKSLTAIERSASNYFKSARLQLDRGVPVKEQSCEY